MVESPLGYGLLFFVGISPDSQGRIWTYRPSRSMLLWICGRIQCEIQPQPPDDTENAQENPPSSAFLFSSALTYEPPLFLILVAVEMSPVGGA